MLNLHLTTTLTRLHFFTLLYIPLECSIIPFHSICSISLYSQQHLKLCHLLETFAILMNVGSSTYVMALMCMIGQSLVMLSILFSTFQGLLTSFTSCTQSHPFSPHLIQPATSTTSPKSEKKKSHCGHCSVLVYPTVHTTVHTSFFVSLYSLY